MVRRLNNLPEEIIFEILSRLPTESVLHCKLVCKPWRDLVHHPPFSRLHLNHLNNSATDDFCNKVSIVFFSRNQQLHREFYYVEFDENCDEILLSTKSRLNLSPDFQNCSVLGSSNGLICFNSWHKGSISMCFGPAYICNPITGEYVILPIFQGVYRWNGFGYNASTNEYKVVRICIDSADPNFGMAQVYTVGVGNGWRNVGEIGMNWKNMKKFGIHAGAFANGTLHWVNYDTGSILAFDLANEKFSEFPSPPCLTRVGIPAHLGVLGDSLSATYHPDAYCSEIWLLKKDKDNSDLRWSKQFSFDKYVHRAFKFTKSGRILCHGSGKVYNYDSNAAFVKMDDRFEINIYEAIPHKNTLVSLKSLGEKDTKTMGSMKEQAQGR